MSKPTSGLTMTKKTGTAGVIHYSPALKKKMKKKAEGKAKRRAARSGEVVTRMVGDEKVSPPSPTNAQINRRERWL